MSAIYYGFRNTAYCAMCAQGRRGLDKKPISKKQTRTCVSCKKPIR